MCKDNQTSLATKCEAMIDCMATKYPCTGNCATECLNMAGGSAAVYAGKTLEPDDVEQQRHPRLSRAHDEHRERVGAASGFHVALTEVQQVASCLHFAGAPQVAGFDAQSLERIAAPDDGVVGENAAELERERVERARKFIGRQHERRGQARLLPRSNPRRARAQIVVRNRIDDGESVDQRRLVVTVRVCGGAVSGIVRTNTVNDEGLHAAAEDLAQVVFERLHRDWDLRHMSIINECVFGS